MTKYHEFKRSNHIGEKSVEVLERELAQIINQWTPLTLHQDEINEFLKVYNEIVNEMVAKVGKERTQDAINTICRKYAETDESFMSPTPPEALAQNPTD